MRRTPSRRAATSTTHESEQGGAAVIRKLSIGYRYWHMQRHSFGWRQLGGELLCVMDDFGTLVPARGARGETLSL